jgi:hypothetical protein
MRSESASDRKLVTLTHAYPTFDLGSIDGRDARDARGGRVNPIKPEVGPD